MLGDVFEFFTEENPVMFAIVGPADTYVDGQNSGSNHVLSAAPHLGVTVRRSPYGSGPIYVAILGLEVPTVLGSASYDTLSKLGPTPVQSGSEYVVTALPNEDLFGRFVLPPKESAFTTQIRIVPGPHVENVLWPVMSTVKSIARSGIRLTTDDELPSSSATLASLPVMPGVVQLPPSGEPIILGPDSGVTGGYPILGVVIKADLPILARLKSNQKVLLVSVEPEDARSRSWAMNVTSVADIVQY
jgi:allophanate hydrolase subunit 2